MSKVDEVGEATGKNNLEKVGGTEVKFFMPNTESLAKLETMEQDFNLTMKYKTAEDWAILKDKPLRVYYMGTREIPNENGEAVNCGVFVSRNECFISGQMTLVEAVKNLEYGIPIEITYRGKKNNKTSDGTTMIFDVTTLK